MSLQDLLIPVGGAPVVSPSQLAAIANPKDGQEVLLQAETAPNTLWHLRWNDGSAEPYQWEFIGGPPMRAYLSTATTLDNTGHGTWKNLDGGLPQLFVPRPGVYYATFGAEIDAPADGIYARAGLSLDGADPSGPVTENWNSRRASMASQYQVTLTSTLRVRMMYERDDSAGNNATFSRRFISIIPVRVS